MKYCTKYISGKLTFSVIFFLLFFFLSCKSKTSSADIDELKEKIVKTEKEFESTVKEKGVQEAFYEFADSNAVIKREDDRLIKGKELIKLYYQNPAYLKDSVSWKPDFVEVSVDGTLAYTYGIYTWKVKDSVGKETIFKGVFHTVWKKQADGTWKYVWD